MSRRKAGFTPRRVDLELEATISSDDDMETHDLVIDAGPEHAQDLSPSALHAPLSPGYLEVEPRSPAATAATAATSLHALGKHLMWLSQRAQDRRSWTDKKPDLLTCGRCRQIFPLEAFAKFLNHKMNRCQSSEDPGSQSIETEDQKTLRCYYCGKEFVQAWKLLRHVQWDHGILIFQTEASQMPVAPLLGLAEVALALSATVASPVVPTVVSPPVAVPVAPAPEAETKVPRSNGSQGRRSTVCPWCHRTLSSPSNLRVHLRSHTGERPYACDQCTYACAQSSKLTRHKKTHQKQPQSPGAAPIKQETSMAPPQPALATAPASTTHQPTSVEGSSSAATAGVQEPGAPGNGAQASPFEDTWESIAPDTSTPLVEASASASASLAEEAKRDPAQSQKAPHKKAKSRTLLWSCEFCGKQFASNSNLTVHRRSHTGERPYVCEFCPYACAQSSKLNRHRRMHGLDPNGPRFVCPHCQVPFGLRATLDKHLRQKHPEVV